MGLPVHDIETDCTKACLLGWEVDGATGSIRPSLRRLWRIRLAIRYILKVGRASGRDLERVIGHATFVSLIARPGLSVFGQVYGFIRHRYDHQVRLWPGVRRELERWEAISPLLWQDLRSGWHDHLVMTDASEWGAGVVASRRDRSSIALAGRCCERNRFSFDDDIAMARAAAGFESKSRNYRLPSDAPDVCGPSGLPPRRVKVRDGPSTGLPRRCVW